MKLCSICWEQKCEHEDRKIEIDRGFITVIRMLNQKGYRTSFCCAGHSSQYLSHNGHKYLMPTHMYIKFSPTGFTRLKTSIEAMPLPSTWEVIKTSHQIECAINFEKMDNKIKTETIKEERQKIIEWVKKLPNMKGI